MVGKQEIGFRFTEFERALKRLKEAATLEKETDIKKDATIQRFEFTFEILWKVFRKIAHFEKLDCFSPRTCFKTAFRMD